MTFEPENIPSFERIFRDASGRIRAFPGCSRLELYRDMQDPDAFFTYSIWEDEAALEAYRNSEFFKEVWGQTRKLFSRPAQAWSLSKQEAI